MNITALRGFVNDHPNGVIIRMVDGTEYKLPHHDCIWFTPNSGKPGSYLATSFYVAHEGVGRLVNALLIAEVQPMKKNGQSKRIRKKSA